MGSRLTSQLHGIIVYSPPLTHLPRGGVNLNRRSPCAPPCPSPRLLSVPFLICTRRLGYICPEGTNLKKKTWPRYFSHWSVMPFKHCPYFSVVFMFVFLLTLTLVTRHQFVPAANPFPTQNVCLCNVSARDTRALHALAHVQESNNRSQQGGGVHLQTNKHIFNNYLQPPN